jgi:hypothetical protein
MGCNVVVCNELGQGTGQLSRSKKPRLTAVGIRCADRATASIR